MVVIGLGSNQGQSREIVPRAMQALEIFAQPGSFQRSRLWQTSPVDCPADSDLFVNAAVCFEALAEVTPEGLLADLKALERDFGRGAKIVRNAPRELDLDLLIFNEERRDTQYFTLPHPRAVERLFVLAPVAEIVPGLRWPGMSTTVRELLDGLETDEQVTPLDNTASST